MIDKDIKMNFTQHFNPHITIDLSLKHSLSLNLCKLFFSKKPIKVAVAIDDIHPEKGWGLPSDKCMQRIHKLHTQFGTKFTLFIPSNHHQKFPLSKHKSWVNELVNTSYFECVAHGHFHKVFKPTSKGEMEFSELSASEAKETI